MAKIKNFEERQKSIIKDINKQIRFYNKECRRLGKKDRYIECIDRINPKPLPNELRYCKGTFREKVRFFCIAVEGIVRDPVLNFYSKAKCIAWLIFGGEF